MSLVGAARRDAAGSDRSSPAPPPPEGPWWRGPPSTGRGMSLLLGIDEGTSAVKAVLFDDDLQPLREASREKPLHHPQPGWVEQDPEDVLEAVVGPWRSVLKRARGGRRLRARPSGRVVLAWDAETGRAADAGGDVAGQALPGGARPARADGRGRRS